MKRKLALVLLLCTVLTTSCVSTRGSLPYGVWQSQTPEITMYIDKPQATDKFSGSVTIGDEVIAVDIYFAVSHKALEIRVGDSVDEQDILYEGTYKFNDETLTLTPERRDSTQGIIVFEKVELPTGGVTIP